MLRENLNTLLCDAMKEKNEAKTRTLRFIKTEYMNYQTAKNAKPLDDSAEIGILKKMVTSREDSVGQYKEAGREELAKHEEEEIEILKSFLPAEISKAAIEEFADSIITERGMHLMGKYVKEIKSHFPTADGKVIAEIVKSRMS